MTGSSTSVARRFAEKALAVSGVLSFAELGAGWAQHNKGADPWPDLFLSTLPWLIGWLALTWFVRSRQLHGLAPDNPTALRNVFVLLGVAFLLTSYAIAASVRETDAESVRRVYWGFAGLLSVGLALLPERETDGE
jgi:hypothetical protein